MLQVGFLARSRTRSNPPRMRTDEDLYTILAIIAIGMTVPILLAIQIHYDGDRIVTAFDIPDS